MSQITHTGSGNPRLAFRSAGRFWDRLVAALGDL
jgi:hypothetical protein